MRRPYWPRHVVVTDSGFNCSHKDAGLAHEHARRMRDSGWHTGVITAHSWDDARAKAEPLWDKYRELNERERERKARAGGARNG